MPPQDIMLPESQVSRGYGARTSGPVLVRSGSALLAAALVTGALLLAPERPEERSSICEKYHSAAACRVW